jgi:hypothetical protein
MKNRFLKNYLIFPRFQLHLLLICLGLTVLILLTIYGVFLLSLSHLYEMGEELRFGPESGYFRLLDGQKIFFQKYLLIAGSGAFFISGLVSIVFSHRIVGPLYRLKLHLQQTQQAGNQAPLQFREKDYFAEIPSLLNDVLSRSAPNNKQD